MTSPSARLLALGVELPAAPRPVAAYVPAVRAGSFVFTSGQLPMVDGSLMVKGKVGAEVSPEAAAGLARICAINALAAISALVSLDVITRVVRVVGYVASSPAFSGQPLVVNGASEFLEEVFGEAGRHARSSVGVAALPLDAPVELELVVEIQ